ncbi:MAG: hypothetical protein KGH53_01615 [Candidatus Micrarchaeota archaeon]|nr:hypothetical protein [Candidatus Micrarchaeota archaeon]
MSLQAKINYPTDKQGYSQMLRKAEIGISLEADGKQAQINFLGKELFKLTADRIKGIRAEAQGVPERNVACYNYDYHIGALKEIDDTAPLLKIITVSNDSRGSIHPVLFKGKEIYNLNATNPFFMRGAHSHPYDIEFHIIYGRGIWIIFREGEAKASIEEQKAGERKLIRKGELHSFIATEPTLLTEMPAIGITGEEFKAENDHHARELMNQFNSKQESFNKLVSEMLRQS